jgi:hypothetical protein
MSIKWQLIEFGNLQGQDEDTAGPLYEIVVLPDGKCQLWFAGTWIFGLGPIDTYGSIRAAMAAAEVQPENFYDENEASS